MTKKFFIPIFCFFIFILGCRFELSAANAQGIMFPFYIYPTTENIQALLDAKSTYPDLELRVIMNPNSGVGKKRNLDYVTAIKTLKKAGISVLGYVATRYANRPLPNVRQEINHWKLWYNPDGLFFDEMSDNHSYYQTLTAYAKDKGFQYTVGNPGDNIGVASANDVDTLNVFENSSLPTLSDFSNWSDYPTGKISMISYNIATYPSSFVTDSKSVFGWIFITNATLPNPYDVYPSYFTQLVDQLGNEDCESSSD